MVKEEERGGVKGMGEEEEVVEEKRPVIGSSLGVGRRRWIIITGRGWKGIHMHVHMHVHSQTHMQRAILSEQQPEQDDDADR